MLTIPITTEEDPYARCVATDHKAYYEKNRQRIIQRTMAWEKRRPEDIKEKRRAQHRAYARRNTRKSYEMAKRRRVLNPSLKIADALRSRVSHLLDERIKSAPTLVLLGCSLERFCAHLESLFKPGMTWENRGQWKHGQPMTWHIDHIRPCASFDLTDHAQQRQCFHWSNMQPLWAVDNIIKSDKWEGSNKHTQERSDG